MPVSSQILAERLSKERHLGRILDYRFAGKVYLVGGALRELILACRPHDYDFVLTQPEDLSVFENILGARAFKLGKKSLQIQRMVARDIVMDITFLNGTLEDDLRRRDFTMNAMAFDVETKRLIDTLGGVADIEKRIIRYPGEYTIPDDPLRMLKAIRHFSTLTGFGIDGALKTSIKNLRGLIKEVAPERIKYELDLIVTSERPYEGLNLLAETGLLFEIFPDLDALCALDREKGLELSTLGHTIEGFRYLGRHRDFYPLEEHALRNVAYALLFHDLGKAHTFSYDAQKGVVHFFYHERYSQELAEKAMASLRFSSQETRTILALIAHHMRIFLITQSQSTEKATRRLVYAMGDLTPSLIALTLCDMYGSSGGEENPSTDDVEERCRLIVEAFEEWKRAPLPSLINGDDLIAAGFTEGPPIGKALERVREKQISGEIRDRHAALDCAMVYLRTQEPV